MIQEAFDAIKRDSENGEDQKLFSKNILIFSTKKILEKIESLSDVVADEARDRISKNALDAQRSRLLSECISVLL